MPNTDNRRQVFNLIAQDRAMHAKETRTPTAPIENALQWTARTGNYWFDSFPGVDATQGSQHVIVDFYGTPYSNQADPHQSHVGARA